MRYTVWHESVSGRDGDAGFDDLAAAEREFEDQTQRTDVATVELIDNEDPENLRTLRRWPE